MARPRTPIKERFWDKVDVRGPNDCWLWTGSQFPTGYGKLWTVEKQLRAHRVVLELAGINVPGDRVVCHKCDTPLCVNPKHLFVADQKANMQDAASKGRTTQGEKNHHAKLTKSDIHNIRKLLVSGMTQRSIAKQFGVVESCISGIKHGRLWAHV